MIAREINGDVHLGTGDRLRYLWRNAIRNHTPNVTQFTEKLRWCASTRENTIFTDASPSPGRALAEAFIINKLPILLPPGNIDILEIGCGSGRARSLLEQAGYSGRYTGVDTRDRFDWDHKSVFASEYLQMDAHNIEPAPSFDLVLSHSVLEHIENDIRLVARLRDTLRPGGVQLHIVPTGAALYAYLWHGYRQYPFPELARRFDPERTSIYALGGFMSLCVHIGFITILEMLLRLPARRVFATPYRICARTALRIDRFFPFAAIMHAVCEQAPDDVE